MRNLPLPRFYKHVLTIFSFLTLSFHLHAQPDVQYSPFIGGSAGLDQPMELVSAPGEPAYTGRIFIVEKPGRIKVWNGSQVLATPFLDITGLVAEDGEHGLLSMAFHPQYQTNGFFFVYYNNNAGNIVVARYKVSAGNPNVANPALDPPSELISIPKNFSNHNGGHLQFRTEAGIPYLYFATGDGGSGNDPDRNSQNPASFLGKMIRINVDVAPFIPEIWAWGLRNPFRWSFDRSTNDIWIGDVGQDAKEEINFNAGGAWGINYGWPCVEGTQANAAAPAGSRCDTVSTLDELPVLDYDNPTEGSSVIGGHVYRGTDFPDLQGYYLATDFYSGRLWFIKPNNPGPGWSIEVKTGMATGVSSISETGDGNLFALSLYTNQVFRLVLPVVTPLNLISFSGKAVSGSNDLTWIAESEQALDKYIVEYSTDGRNYLVAGEVAARNTGNRNTYTFKHVINSNGPVLYRLRITEQTGSAKYSAIITLGSKDRLGIKLYPTIAVNNTVNIISAEPIRKIVFVNSDGKQVWWQDMNGANGYFSISFPALPKGLYLVRLSTEGNTTQTEKIVVQ